MEKLGIFEADPDSFLEGFLMVDEVGMGQALPTKHERSILSVEKPRLFSAKEANDREVDRLMVF